MSRGRLLEINDLLSQFRKELIRQPNRVRDIASRDNVYHHLVRYNTSDDFDCSKFFDYWINNNRRENTNVFVDPSWSYFCQFISQGNKLRDSSKHHKIYLSLRPDYLREGVERLFDFLSRENIPHISKIGKRSRDDQIVVRVGTAEDCEKVIDFINNDSYIQRGKKKANPFSFQYRGVALATDGNVSYNECMALTLKLYLKEMIDNNRINEINVNSFIEFVVNYYNKYFINMTDVDKVMNDFQVGNRLNSIQNLVDYKYCLKLFLNAFNERFDLEKYEEMIEEKNRNIEADCNLFKNALGEQNYINLFKELCNTVIGKSGYYEGRMRIKRLFNSSDARYITNDNNLRRRVDNSSFINYINEYVRKRNISIDDLINRYYQKSSLSMVSLSIDELLRRGISTTYHHHQRLYEEGKDRGTGYQYAKSAIVRLLRDGVYDGFTRFDDTRIQIMNYISREDAYRIVLRELGITHINSDELIVACDNYLRRIFGFGKTV